MSIEPYVYIKKINFFKKEEVISYFQKLEQKFRDSSVEGYFDLEIDKDFLSLKYYRVLSTTDLIVDNLSKQVLSDEISSVIKADIIINFYYKTLVIWGRPSIYKSLYSEFLHNKHFEIKSTILQMDCLIKSFKDVDAEIVQIALKDVRILGKHVTRVSFSTNNTEDAIYLAKKIGAKIVTIKFKIPAKINEFFYIEINLLECEFKFSTTILMDSIVKEKLEEIINTMNLN
ncbi:hypothetical protein [Lysinibacillus capsici]|uniref:hypothetical protein n=1 Tax=Lysinibacillus capsici TaxID=2115968 RepID=UPI0027A4EBA6|nr:hypothetical protein QIX46_23645 [Lysinibacillus boronitolerans]